LVRSRSRCKNEIHAVLMRRLKGRCPFSDMFGKAGREWLRSLELPVEECETVEATMRQIEFLDAEIAEVDRLIAEQALLSGDARHLMSVPGVNVVCAATFLAVIGDIRRFRTSRQLVAYLGLDPKVRQSGSEPARIGRISKQGLSADTLGTGRSDAQRRATARALARVPPADPRPPWLPGRDCGGRPEVGVPALRYVSHSRPPTTYRRHATPTSRRRARTRK
jgi:transposase